MKRSEQPIGIFDSGVGGLTVAQAIRQALPNERLVYFGDTVHMPYGEKSPEHIRQFCSQIVEFLISQDVKVIVIACNTASAIAAGYLRSKYWQQVEIIGVIRPVIQKIIQDQISSLGILGTHATIGSGIYPQLIQEYGATLEVFQLATPLLAPMIEEGLMDTEVSKAVLHQYLSNPGFTECEALLLACTHYPLLRQEISDFFSGTKRIYDNAVPLARMVKKYLSDYNLLAESRQGENRFFVSEQTAHFENTARLFYGQQISIQKIDLTS